MNKNFTVKPYIYTFSSILFGWVLLFCSFSLNAQIYIQSGAQLYISDSAEIVIKQTPRISDKNKNHNYDHPKRTFAVGKKSPEKKSVEVACPTPHSQVMWKPISGRDSFNVVSSDFVQGVCPSVNNKLQGVFFTEKFISNSFSGICFVKFRTHDTPTLFFDGNSILLVRPPPGCGFV